MTEEGTFQRSQTDGGYWAGELARQVRYAEACDADIAVLQGKIKEIRKQKRGATKEHARIMEQLAYDAYTSCITCFPYRDWDAAAAAKGEHSCGLTAAQRIDIHNKHFKD